MYSSKLKELLLFFFKGIKFELDFKLFNFFSFERLSFEFSLERDFDFLLFLLVIFAVSNSVSESSLIIFKVFMRLSDSLIDSYRQFSPVINEVIKLAVKSTKLIGISIKSSTSFISLFLKFAINFLYSPRGSLSFYYFIFFFFQNKIILNKNNNKYNNNNNNISYKIKMLFLFY